MVALSLAMPFSLNLTQMLLALAVGMAAGILPLSYFGLGTRELSFIALFPLYNLSKEDAVSFSIMFLLCYPLGIFCTFAVNGVTRILWGSLLDESFVSGED